MHASSYDDGTVALWIWLWITLSTWPLKKRIETYRNRLYIIYIYIYCNYESTYVKTSYWWSQWSHWLQRVPAVGCAQRDTLFSSSTGTSSGSESASHVLGQRARWFWTWTDLVNVHKVLWDSWQSYYHLLYIYIHTVSNNITIIYINLLYILYISVYHKNVICYVLSKFGAKSWSSQEVLFSKVASRTAGSYQCCILRVHEKSHRWAGETHRGGRRVLVLGHFGMVILYDFLTCWLVKHCLGSQLISQQLGN